MLKNHILLFKIYTFANLVSTMLLAITNVNQQNKFSVEADKIWTECGYTFSFCHSNDPFAVEYSDQDSLRFFTSKPIFRHADGAFSYNHTCKAFHDWITRSENNFSAFEYLKNDGGWTMSFSSARMTRSRMYMCTNEGTIIFSDDLRQLLPYTDRKLNPEAAFSVLKYGEVPEYITVIKGIHSIPVGTYLTFSQLDVQTLIERKAWLREHFKPFFKLAFPMDGGDISKTESLLQKQFEFISTLNPLVPISGGVDSTLINCLIDRFSNEAYPAYFMRFGDDDPELEFAIKAAKASKAELYIGTLQPTDLVRSFAFQASQLVEPIGESSTISLAFYFSQHLKAGHHIIDGTLADGCYGSTNYTRNVLEAISDRPIWQQKLNEKIAAFLQFNDLPGKDRFFPRDSLMNDEYLKFMDVYLGPFANTWVKNSEAYCKTLLPLWQDYYNFLETPVDEQDDWMKYSVFKMVNYACKNNTAKTFDNAKPDNLGLYPFTWKSVLNDQGHYSWKEKTQNNIIKYPLKKILAQYMPDDFIYRKKVGLNACFEDWIHTNENRIFLTDLLSRQSGISEFFLGKSRRDAFIRKFNTSTLHPNLSRLVINLSLLQGWMDHNRVSVDD